MTEPAIQLDLRENTNLSELTLDGLVLDEQQMGETRRKSMKWVPMLLSSITSHQLRKVILNVTLSKRDVRERLQRFNLEEVDDILAREQFSGTRIIGIIINLLPDSEGRQEALKTVQERMPKSHARGVLCTTPEELRMKCGN